LTALVTRVMGVLKPSLFCKVARPNASRGLYAALSMDRGGSGRMHVRSTYFSSGACCTELDACTNT